MIRFIAFVIFVGFLLALGEMAAPFVLSALWFAIQVGVVGAALLIWSVIQAGVDGIALLVLEWGAYLPAFAVAAFLLLIGVNISRNGRDG